MNIGIMQGRLSPPVNGHIQEFPDDWKNEFSIMKECGFIGAEWLVTTGRHLDNPLFREPHEVSQYPITSICMDVLVDQRIVDGEFLNQYLLPLCEVLMSTLSLRTITIPLLEQSDMKNDTKRRKFCLLIGSIGQQYPEINFSFEAELEPEKLEEIISLCDNFYVTYDTGNITSCGFDHAGYISFFGNRINNVHLKDRTFSARTVQPFTGDTNFKEIFKALYKIGYSGPFILQTARNISGQERETMLYHKQLFEKHYETYI